MIALAVAIQVAPLAGPVLLSTDVYTYWDYGRLSAVHGANPYEDEPSTFPDDPAYPRMGAQWRDTTSVYGPGFTLASEAHAVAVGESAGAAAWVYKAPRRPPWLPSPLLAARLGSRPVFAAAFVGWNPLLALHFAGGGHNDAWMMAFVLAALALAAAGRRQLAGVAWAASIAVKWLPIVFLPLRALEARATPASRPSRLRRCRDRGGRVRVRALDGVGQPSGRWPTTCATRPATASQTGWRSSAFQSRSRDLLAVLFAGAYVWLLVEAWRGRARLGLCAGLLLLATPWLVPWYAVWAVPLAAVEEDAAARWLALGLSAYLLRDAVLSNVRSVNELISIAEAQKLVLERAKRLEAERVPIERAAGRVLAEPAIAAVDLPPFPSSAMDGFAVRAADTTGAPVTLPVVARIAAGSPAPGRSVRGDGDRDGRSSAGGRGLGRSDRARRGDRRARRACQAGHRRSARSSTRRRHKGGRADSRAGNAPRSRPGRGARRGRRVGGAVREAPARRHPCHGVRLRTPGETLEAGQIYESNGLLLATALQLAGAVPAQLGVVADDAAEHERAMERALLGFDMLVTSGGASVGVHDLVRETQAKLRVEEIFWGVAVKPGKPVAFGVRRDHLVFNLPGNPSRCS